jgi:hypothetical protein
MFYVAFLCQMHDGNSSHRIPSNSIVCLPGLIMSDAPSRHKDPGSYNIACATIKGMTHVTARQRGHYKYSEDMYPSLLVATSYVTP